jgi:hypothetical protein
MYGGELVIAKVEKYKVENESKCKVLPDLAGDPFLTYFSLLNFPLST